MLHSRIEIPEQMSGHDDAGRPRPEAGLAPDEIAHLTARSIVPVSDNCHAVALDRRIVPLRRKYASLIVDLAEDLDADEPLIRQAPVPRIETLWLLLSRCDVPEPLRPLTVSRLRATWAHAALNAPIALPHIVAAYGVLSTAFISPLLPSLLSAVNPDAIVADTSPLYDF